MFTSHTYMCKLKHTSKINKCQCNEKDNIICTQGHKLLKSNMYAKHYESNNDH